MQINKRSTKSYLYNTIYKTETPINETIIVNATILLTIFLTHCLLLRSSIRNLNAAVCICNVIAGKYNDAKIVIKSYDPYSFFVKQPVKIGNIINDVSRGKKVPIDKIKVFFISFLSLFIYKKSTY